MSQTLASSSISSKTGLSIAAGLAMLASMAIAPVQAANWSDTSVGMRYVSEQSEPGVTDSVSKNVMSFTHVSGDNMGSNFFTIDLLKSSSIDPSNKGPSGAQEWYGFYKRSFSLSAMTGNNSGYGIAKDLSLIARFDAGTKNTTFAPAPRKVRLGMSAAMPVTAGFWDVGLEVMKESNHNGVVGKDVSFSSAPVFTTAWAVGMGPGAFTGFLDIVGAKGKDGFGDETKTETLGRALYMIDVAGPKAGLKAGVGVEYWNNKFGCNNAKSFKKNSCTATTPVLIVEYHM
jgi:hypothetical protein